MKLYMGYEEEIIEDEFYIEKYRVSNRRITRMDYDFKCYRESRMYEEDSYWAEENHEFYCNIRATRIA